MRRKEGMARFSERRACSLKCGQQIQGRRQIKSDRTRYHKTKVGDRIVSVHRAVMEQHIGRSLRVDELVHHRNGDKRDNRIKNLEIMSALEHGREHNLIYSVTKTCEACGAEYTPHKTKRKRAKTCSWACRNEMIARSRRKAST